MIDLDPEQSVSTEVRTWFEGAADVNQSIGAFSAFIRNYTANQYLSRTGAAIPSGALQDASNGIASKVLNGIVNEGHIPSLHDIGRDDIDRSSTIFQGDTKAWSGNLLFGMLGDPSFFDSNIIPDPTETYDLLVAVKSAFVALGSVNDTLGDIGQVAFTGISLLLPPGVSSTGTVLGMVNRSNNFLHEAYGLTLPQIAGMRILLNQQNASSTVLGTSGSEIIHASDGQDVIMGSAGGDIIDGGLGSDTASYANTSSPITFDVIEHTSTVRFTASAINAAAGISDYLFDIERIVGSGSADTFNLEFLRHDQTSLTLDGGGGDDRFNINILPFNGKELAINGGSGVDTVSFDFFNASMRLNSLQETATIASYTIGITGVERLIGTRSDDTFILHRDDIVIQGGSGSDIVDYGTATNAVHLEEGVVTQVETIRGSAGADILVGQQGATMFGGLGDDTFLSIGSSTFFVGGEFGESGTTSPNGIDTLSFQRLNTGVLIDMHSGTASNGDSFRGMEIIVGTGHADIFEAVTNFQQFGSQKTIIHGGNGNDVMTVVGGVEAYGDNDDDTFHVDGYLGSLSSGFSPGIPTSGSTSPTHRVHGGSDYDRLVIGASTGGMGVTATAGSGSGSIGTLTYDGIEEIIFDASFINVNGSGGANVIRGGLVSSTLRGGGGSDVLYARGSAQDYLYGDDGADFLYGNGGDEIRGGSGNDTIYAGEGGQSYLYGDDGDDKIYGGPGNDVIYGGKGNDLIYGGDGDDYVNYTYADGSLISVTNHGSYFEVVTGTVTGGTVNSDGWWVPTYTYETDLLYGCEYLFVNGSGWQLTPDFSYPNF